jgi:type II secretory pathway pseudopilin PulG
MVGAGLFLLIQLALLVDMAHSWSEYLIERYEESSSKQWAYTLIGSTLVMAVLSLAMTGVLFSQFASNACQLNQFYVSFNLILLIFSMFLSSHPSIQEAKPQSGLFPGVLVGLYSTYLIFSAVLSEPTDNNNEVCNPWAKNSSGRTTVVMGALFTFFALAYSTTRLANRGMYAALATDEETGSSLIQREPESRSMRVQSAIESGALHPSTADDHDVDDSKYSPDDEEEGCTYNYSLFHLVYALATMYVAMLLTDWNSVAKRDDLVRVGQSWVAVWVKIVSSWVVHLLYNWTLLAPVYFPDREWE